MQGQDGDDGNPGDRGADGSKGEMGEVTFDMKTSKGEQGDFGDDGPPGFRGSQGARGPQGKSFTPLTTRQSLTYLIGSANSELNTIDFFANLAFETNAGGLGWGSFSRRVIGVCHFDV